MADAKTIVVQIKAESGAAIKSIAETQEAMKRLKEQTKVLTDAIKAKGYATNEEARTLAANQQAMKAYQREVQVLTREVQNNYKITQEQEGSLVALRAELSNLTSQYDALSRAEREGAKGQELQNKINAITNEIKGSEEATQRYYRNVGNYAGSIAPLIEQQVPQITMLRQSWNSLADLMRGSIAELKNIGAGFRAATSEMGGFTAGQKAATVASSGLTAGLKVLKVALISTGIGAIVVALGSLVSYFTKTQAGVEMASKAMAGLGAAVDVVIDRVSKFGGSIVKVFSGDFKGAASDAKAAFAGLGQEIANDTKQAVALRDAEMELEKQELSLEAKRAAQKVTLAELKRVADDTTKSYEERRRAAEQATAIEMQTAAEINRLGEQKIANALGYLEVTDEVRNTIEQLKQGADADAIIANLGLSESTIKDYEALVGTFKQYQQGVQEFSQMAVEGTNKLNAIRQQAAAARQAALDKELDELAKVVDAEIALMADGLEKQRAEENVAYERKIAALKERLATEKNLTIEARSALNQQLELAEKQHQANLDAIDKEGLMQRLEEEATTIQMRLDVAQQGSEEELALKQEQLAKQLEIDLQNDQLTDEQRLLLQEKYWQDSFALDEQYWAAEGEAASEAAQKEVDAAKEAAEVAKAESEARTAAVAQTLGAMSGLLADFGGKSKAMAIASKALALGEIAINTGKALASGIASASGVPFPGNLAAIATTITTVLANIATAIKTVKGAKFATGGYVSGRGTATSDSIPAMLSNGESVSSAATTSLFSPILSALNQMGGGAPIVPTTMAAGTSVEMGEDMLARAVAKGVSQLNITVGVDEITRVQNNVKYIERLSQL